MSDVAAHRLGQVEAYFTVREVLSEESTASDGVLSRERSVFCRCRCAILGFTFCQILLSFRGDLVFGRSANFNRYVYVCLILKHIQVGF